MIRIAYIGGQKPSGFDTVWGGSMATNYAFQTAFKDDSEYCIDLLERKDIRGPDDIRRFCKNADIVHLDDTSIAGMMFVAGMETPDVIGPITRSPTKNYKGWNCPYSADWFYRSRVIRLNYQEERKSHDKVSLVTHGVDTKMLFPSIARKPQYVLWAGMSARWAKNYELWGEIRDKLPSTIETHTMSKFCVRDYWQALDDAALFVCTSRYESFCSAAFEAMAKGVPVVWQHNLQGGFWEDAGIRCDYTVDGFVQAIKQALANQEELSYQARDYVLNNCTLKHMRDSYAKIYREVLHYKSDRGIFWGEDYENRKGV